MPRVIIYPRPGVRPARSEGEPSTTYGERTDAGVAAAAQLAADDYAGRLVKYIPAETLAFVVFGTSFASEHRGHVAAVVAVGAIGQILWLRTQGQRVPAADRPGWRYYLLSLAAYAAWVLGTCGKVRALCGIDETSAAITLGAVAYLLPWIDPATHAWLDQKAEPPRTRR